MPTLEINGREVEIDDSFLRMSPEQQDATVNEIAQSLARTGEGGQRLDPGHNNVPEFVPPGVEGYDPETGQVEAKHPGALSTFMTAGAEGVPLIGGMLDKATLAGAAGLGSMVSGKSFAQVQREMGEIRDKGRAEHPIARLGGNVTGAITTMAPLGATAMGARAFGLKGPSMGARTVAAGTSSAGLSGTDTLARGGSLDEAGRNATIGGGIGMLVPGAGRMISQMGSKAATAAAPTADALKTAGSGLYKQAFDAGVALKAPAFDRSLWSVAAKLKSFGFDRDLHPRTSAVLSRLSEARGKPIDLQELDNLRRLASQAARGIDASDADAARIVIDAIDDLVDDAANFSLSGAGRALPAPGQAAANPTAGLQALKEARSHWHTARKSETIDELFHRAEIKAGTAKGPDFAKKLQAEFQSLALRKNGLRGFTSAERKAIENVARSLKGRGAIEGLGRYLRGLTGTSLAGLGGFAAGGPVGSGAAVAGMAVLGRGMESGARRSASRATISAAERAAAAIRSGGSLTGGNYAPNVASPLEKALRPAPLLQDRRPGNGR